MTLSCLDQTEKSAYHCLGSQIMLGANADGNFQLQLMSDCPFGTTWPLFEAEKVRGNGDQPTNI
jgi:hypothetical protein